MNHYKKIAQELLSHADVTINGNRPWDIKVHNDSFYSRVLKDGSLGLGESYMDGWWDCKRVDEFICRLIKADLESKVKNNAKTIIRLIMAKIFNFQSKMRAFQIGEKHYNIGNDLFGRMLDKRMVYSCGYWKNAKDLDEAQEAKLDLVCKKVGLKPGMKLLDIGCGWGSLAKYAAEKYKAEVTGITISKEQVELGNKLCKGLPVKIKLQDYRKVNGKFDAIISVGMFEHVGYKNYRHFMKVAHRCLKDDGIFLLHTIGINKSQKNADPWINKYIFPNGMNPSLKQIGASAENMFVIEDIHNFGPDYDKTLMAWHKNFQKAWPSLKDKYDDRFKRMWDYYLLVCAGSLRARNLQLWQIVMTKPGRKQPNSRIS
ncbi:cyclopropane fatty acyl phospholipid synthase [Candidatus Woesearchaeota archaeon]|nr:cyclopropane fatty acyl phospholipid synthase [Candidatus Woesearchaeota archaeon]